MNNKVIIVGAVIGVIALLTITLVSKSLRKLKSYEVGLKYDTVWRKLQEQPKYEGLYTGPPGFQFIKFPSIFKTLSFDSLSCLNEDGVPIILDVSYQYKARPQNLHQIIMQFRDHEGYETILQAAGNSAIHEACSKYNTSQFQAERGRFQEDVRAQLVERCEELKCDITDLQVNNIQRPGAYETAINEKERARENIRVATNERPRKITEANTVKREAETQANITIAKAESDSRIFINRALAQAEAIGKQFDTEAKTFQKLMSSSGMDLDVDGFLSYMGVRVIEGAKNPVYVGLKSPAKSSYVNP